MKPLCTYKHYKPHIGPKSLSISLLTSEVLESKQVEYSALHQKLAIHLGPHQLNCTPIPVLFCFHMSHTFCLSLCSNEWILIIVTHHSSHGSPLK